MPLVAAFAGGEVMSPDERIWLRIVVFYVCCDALPKFASFCERVAGWVK